MTNERIEGEWVLTRREFDPGEIADAKALFMEHGPEHPHMVLRGLRALGWKKFRLMDLFGNGRRRVIGLVKALGWDEEWREKKRRRMRAEAAARRAEGAADPPEAVCEELAVAAEQQTEAVAASSKAAVPKFPEWLERTKPEWHWRWKYQSHIYKRLDSLTRGKAKRLAIFLPPRHGKSELVTVRYAAWRLLKDPRLRIVIASYNQKLANRFSRCVRTIYRQAAAELYFEHQSGLVLKTADEWETAAGGGVKAVGVGAGITGFGADLIIVDDPIKSRAEAESENNRDRIWEWYTDDLLTRLEPKGSVVLIQTRWHEDDLAGRLIKESCAFQVPSSRLKSRGGDAASDGWEVVCLPALAEAGDPLGRKPGLPLCSDRFDRDALLRKKAEMGSYSFAALYQQRPVPAEGGLFKREWFAQVADKAPEGLRWCRGYDLAVSTKTSADYTASFRCALDGRGNLYIADGFRKRVEYPDQRRYIVGRMTEEKQTEHGIELALHGQAFLQEIRRETRLCGRPVRGIRVTVDKYTRALAWANRAEEGKVVLVRGAWNDEFLEEVCRFPNGAHDDQVDAVSLAVQMLEEKKKFAYGF